MRMRAAVLEDFGEPLVVQEVELAEPAVGEVLVRLVACGVCHTDMYTASGADPSGYAPCVLGHEGAGVVEELGEGVTGLEPGDPVVLAWRSPCGACPACLRGEPRRCRSPLRARRRIARARDGERVSQTLLVGAFATRTNVHAGAAIKVPAELPPEQACLIGCAVATGVGSVLHTSRPWPGASVAVIGCGAVGLSAVQGARLAGAGRIVAVDLAPRKLEWALRFGATDTVDASAVGAVEGVLALTGGEGVDFAYEAVGRPETMEQAVRVLGHGGTATLIGVPSPGKQVTFELERDLFDRRATIRVSHGGDHLPADDFPLLAGFALAGDLDLAGMVTRVTGLDGVDQALGELAGGEVIRSVIRFPEG